MTTGRVARVPASPLASHLCEMAIRLVVMSLLALLASRGEEWRKAAAERWSAWQKGRGSGHPVPPDVAAMVETRLASFPLLRDVGGHEGVKEELRASVVRPLRHAHLFYGPDAPRSLRPPRGVLLHGPPGTGKTLLARATAREAEATFLALTTASLESKWWGDTPKLLKACFDAARGPLAPCVVFMDEVDGMGRARSEGDQQCVYSFKCELLRCLDSVDGAFPVAVVACTNCPDSLDAALRRRFEREVRVPPPSSAEEREAILRAVMGGGEGENVAKVAKVAREVALRSEGHTGADLASLFEAASARRVRGREMEDALSSPDVQTGRDLLHRLGPLDLSHWEEAARERGRPLLPAREAETKKK